MNQLLICELTNLSINFDELDTKDFDDAFELLVPQMRGEFLSKKDKKTFKELYENSPINDRVSYITKLLSSLVMLTGDDQLLEIQEKWGPIIHEIDTELYLNKDIFNTITYYTKTTEFKNLSQEIKNSIEKTLKDLKKNGVDLDENNKKKIIKLEKEETELSQLFEKNIKNSESAMKLEVTKEDLNGCPDRIIKNAKELAKQSGLKKYLLSETSQLYYEVMELSPNTNLKKKIYEQWKASCIGGDNDNSEIANKINLLKQERAKILGFKNYAELALSDNMLKNPSEVIEFTENILNAAKKQAINENDELINFGKKLLNKENIEYWDQPYVQYHYQKQKNNLDSEELRKYFPLNYTFEKILNFCEKMFGLKFEITKTSSWNDDVKYFDVKKEGELIGNIYFDLYSRDGKSPGAWVDTFLSRNISSDNIKTLPLVFLACNFSQDLTGETTIPFDDLVTLFHEIGHAIHHLSSKINTDLCSGIHGVEHDAVELPSQLMENFCYDFEVLKEISSHVETGNKINEDWFNKIKESKNFLGASSLMRQGIYSLSDMLTHMQEEKKPIEIEIDVCQKNKYKEYDTDKLFMPTFSHLFSNSYSAGYYAYQYAEVLSTDAYEAFNEVSELSKKMEVAKKYEKHILSTGSFGDMKDKFIAFRGRMPDVKALLKSYGIKEYIKNKNRM